MLTHNKTSSRSTEVTYWVTARRRTAVCTVELTCGVVRSLQMNSSRRQSSTVSASGCTRSSCFVARSPETSTTMIVVLLASSRSVHTSSSPMFSPLTVNISCFICASNKFLNVNRYYVAWPMSEDLYCCCTFFTESQITGGRPGSVVETSRSFWPHSFWAAIVLMIELCPPQIWCSSVHAPLRTPMSNKKVLNRQLLSRTFRDCIAIWQPGAI